MLLWHGRILVIKEVWEVLDQTKLNILLNYCSEPLTRKCNLLGNNVYRQQYSNLFYEGKTSFCPNWGVSPGFPVPRKSSWNKMYDDVLCSLSPWGFHTMFTSLNCPKVLFTQSTPQPLLMPQGAPLGADLWVWLWRFSLLRFLACYADLYMAIRFLLSNCWLTCPSPPLDCKFHKDKGL